ncbi:MAG: aspartate aminotransferase family protein [Myxococcales bacterium]|nr:aspartate aminotransferase family protein [Myxococcales bacterium]
MTNLLQHLPQGPPQAPGPELITAIPGPRSTAWIDQLVRYECPAITARRSRRSEQTGIDQDPIVWERAEGANIWDVDGNRYVDLTGAFAVMAMGHSHPAISGAIAEQSRRLIHGMGDVFPSVPKIELSRRLAEVTPGDLERSILAQSGAAAVEAALKTAVMATGKTGVIAFHGAYHGLSYGALGATAYRRSFREPFRAQFNPQVVHAPYPGADGGPYPATEQGAQRSLEYLEYLLASPATGVGSVGAILFEPIQGRGGEITPPGSWVRGLRRLADRHGLVLIADEIYSGLGRTGRWFACEHYGVVPDILCVGKALGGGLPVSAAVGRRSVMDAWGHSQGEAIHTSTFLGNPVGCASALAALDVIASERLVPRAATLGAWLHGELLALKRRHPERLGEVRGRGLMLGLPVQDANGAPDGFAGLRVVDGMLKRGYLMLPSGVHGHVLAFAPPLIISRDQLAGALEALDLVLSELE